MKTINYPIVIFLTLMLVYSCAPSPENASIAYNDGTNYILLGFWHGIIVPLAAAGKIAGLNIGLYDSGKDVLSYWLGYIFALMIYAKILRLFLMGLKFRRDG